MDITVDLPTLDVVCERYVQIVLEHVEGNRTKAALYLGIDRRTLLRWLEAARMRGKEQSNG